MTADGGAWWREASDRGQQQGAARGVGCAKIAGTPPVSSPLPCAGRGALSRAGNGPPPHDKRTLTASSGLFVASRTTAVLHDLGVKVAGPGSSADRLELDDGPERGWRGMRQRETHVLEGTAASGMTGFLPLARDQHRPSFQLLCWRPSLLSSASASDGLGWRDRAEPRCWLRAV